jgi:serine/threonine protein kinase
MIRWARWHVHAAGNVRPVSPEALHTMTDLHDTLAAEEPAEAADLAGQVLDGRYELVEKLGAGGMGVVYAARHVVLKTRLAIKVLRPPSAGHAAEALERFRREARAASALGHPNIVDVKDFGTLPGGLSYYVMEHLEGTDLLAAVENTQGMATARLAHIGLQIAEALAAAHEQGIVHRDLKPENVFLTTRHGQADHVKLIDFGIAKVSAPELASTLLPNSLPPMGQLALGMMPASSLGRRFTAAGIVLGTPAYMSPEQCAGRDVDFRSDLYALGILLFEAATGTLPFDADSVFDLMRMHQHLAAQDPRILTPELPDEIAEVILACLEKDPGKRPRDMRAVGAVLARYAPVIEAGPSAAAIEEAVRKSVSFAARPSVANDTPQRLYASVAPPPGSPDEKRFAGGPRAEAGPSTPPTRGRPSSRMLVLGGLAAVGAASAVTLGIALAWLAPTGTAAEHAAVPAAPVAAPVAVVEAPSIPTAPVTLEAGPEAGPETDNAAGPETDNAAGTEAIPAETAPPAESPRPPSRRVRIAEPAPSTDPSAAPSIGAPVDPFAPRAPRRPRPTEAVRDPWAD